MSMPPDKSVKPASDKSIPLSEGGKGDKARKSTAETRKAFESGYDAIDWSKKK
jgi:hypothetical protein